MNISINKFENNKQFAFSIYSKSLNQNIEDILFLSLSLKAFNNLTQASQTSIDLSHFDWLPKILLRQDGVSRI